MVLPDETPFSSRKWSFHSLFIWITLVLAPIFVVTGSTWAATDRLSAHAPALQPAHIPTPQSSTPLDGNQLYQFWCSTCHGDRGQGLTAEWRATWPKEKQNCWQAKCHSSSHPVDGFSIPKKVPALIGPDTLGKFNTAQDLYAYIRVAMPYWSPNLLKNEEYWAITVFLVKANYQQKSLTSPSPQLVDLNTLVLHPETQSQPPLKISPLPSQPISTPYSFLPNAKIWLGLLSLAALSLLLLFFTRRTS